MSEVINLSSEKFSSFLSILGIMQNSCKNLIAKKGKICQTNDSVDAIYDIDISELIGENDLLISGTKTKKELLDPFKEQDVDIILTIDNSNYTFKDEFTKMVFMKPKESILTNTNKPIDNIETTLDVNGFEEVFNVNLNSMLLRRISAYRKTMTSDFLTIELDSATSDLKIYNQDKSPTMVGSIISVDNMKTTFSGSIDVKLNNLILNTDCLELSLNYRPKKEDFILSASAVVGRTPDIKVNIWCLASMSD